MDPTTLEWLNQLTPSAAIVLAAAIWSWRSRANGKNGKNGNGIAPGMSVTLHLDEESKRYLGAITAKLDAIHLNTHDIARNTADHNFKGRGN